MEKEKRFYLKPNFGHWSVVDGKELKWWIGYSKKKDAEATRDGLNRIKKDENLNKMKVKLTTLEGYGHFARLAENAAAKEKPVAVAKLSKDVFDDTKQLMTYISTYLGRKSYTNNADWGGASVWNKKKSGSNYVGDFLYMGDDELLFLRRKSIEDEYQDKVISSIENVTQLKKVLAKFER